MTTTSIFWDKKARREPGGFVIELPTLTCERMVELFGHGAGMKGQRKEKYSRSVLVRLKPSNQLYALYMSCGYWRIGGCGTMMSRIGDLLIFLDPIKYKGLEILRDDVALRVAEQINQGYTVGEAFDIVNGVTA